MYSFYSRYPTLGILNLLPSTMYIMQIPEFNECLCSFNTLRAHLSRCGVKLKSSSLLEGVFNVHLLLRVIILPA